MTNGDWNNWSGAVRATPAAQAQPRTVEALRTLILDSDAPIRVRGAGHSFTPLCATPGTLVALDALDAPLVEPLGTNDMGEQLARLHAGASLRALSQALQAHGLAFRNLGDIDVQSLAGATATATHGTGRQFPCLSGELRAITLMTADGELRELGSRELEGGHDREQDRAQGDSLLDAARVALGALGIIVSADVRVQSAFKLHRKARVRRYIDVLQDAQSLWQEHRNFEFFVLPHSDYALALTHDETSAEDMAEHVGDDHADLRKLMWLRSALGWAPGLRRWVLNRVLGSTADAQQVGTSWQLLASDRRMRFHEMEYHLPVSAGLQALDEVRTVIERERREVFFPIECRFSAADTGWLSPFQHAPRISVAVHAHQADDYAWLYSKVEPIFRRHGGRPHWGKLHSLAARDLAELYPDFSRFCVLRRELDPRGRFLNAHTAQLFGEPTP